MQMKVTRCRFLVHDKRKWKILWYHSHIKNFMNNIFIKWMFGPCNGINNSRGWSLKLDWVHNLPVAETNVLHNNTIFTF